MAPANGEELRSRGCGRLDALNIAGNKISQTVEDADVDMPIMAVIDLSANGELGSSVVFNVSWPFSPSTSLSCASSVAFQSICHRATYTHVFLFGAAI